MDRLYIEIYISFKQERCEIAGAFSQDRDYIHNLLTMLFAQE